jgi:hypothetical protein
MKPNIQQTISSLSGIFKSLYLSQNLTRCEEYQDYVGTWLRKDHDHIHFDAIYLEFAKEYDEFPIVGMTISLFEQVSLIPNLDILSLTKDVTTEYVNQRIPVLKRSTDEYIITVTEFRTSFGIRIDYLQK